MIFDFLILFVFFVFFLLIIALCALSGYLMLSEWYCLEQSLVSQEAPCKSRYDERR